MQGTKGQLEPLKGCAVKEGELRNVFLWNDGGNGNQVIYGGFPPFT